MSEVKERRVMARFFAEASTWSQTGAPVQLVVYSDGELSLVVPGKEPVQIAKWGQRPTRSDPDVWEDCALPTKETP